MFTSSSHGGQASPRETAANDAFTLRLPPSPASSRTARAAIEVFLRQRNAEPGAVADFMTAVGEALANAIEHSRCKDSILVSVSYQNSRVQVSVSDSGIGFDCKDRPTDLPPAFSERGRGMAIMVSCTDGFDIESRSGAGTTVTLHRRFPPSMSLETQYTGARRSA